MNRAERFWQTEAATPLGEAGSSVAPAIAVERLTKLYNGHAAVNGVSFAAPAGSIVGLLGGNGAGKTTTIAMIMGLVIPTRGSVRVLGHDMTRARHKVLHRMNFQSPYVPLPGRLTVRQNLTVFGRLYGVERLRTRIDELVDTFSLATVLDRPTGALSAGQRTRVALAKAFMNRPEVLLLDEPTASLDPDRAEWVRDQLIEYRRVRKATILLSSHNMAEVERLCDLVVVLSAGRIADMGAPRVLMHRHGCGGLEEVFLRLVRYDEPWRGAAD